MHKLTDVKEAEERKKQHMAMARAWIDAGCHWQRGSKVAGSRQRTLLCALRPSAYGTDSVFASCEFYDFVRHFSMQ